MHLLTLTNVADAVEFCVTMAACLYVMYLAIGL